MYTFPPPVPKVIKEKKSGNEYLSEAFQGVVKLGVMGIDAPSNTEPGLEAENSKKC